MKNMLMALLALWAFGAQAAPLTRIQKCTLTELAAVDLLITEDAVFVPATITTSGPWTRHPKKPSSG